MMADCMPLRWSGVKTSLTATTPEGRMLPLNRVDDAISALKKVGAMLTELSDEQAEYIGVQKQGPYKPDTYRY